MRASGATPPAIFHAGDLEHRADRHRVQRAVDRRFNRVRYDAEALVAAFTARLRRTIDLDTTQGDLAGLVHEAFQPAHVSVWLPGTGPHAATPAPARTGGGLPDT